jgi:AMP phosphorylase
MKLKVKEVGISSGGPLIVILNEEDAQQLDIHPLEKVKLSKGNGESLVVGVDINLSKRKGIKKGEAGLFEEVLKELDTKSKQIIDVEYTPKPKSIGYIKKKLDGYRLSEEEINEIVKDTVNHKLTQVDLTYFISACFTRELDLKETVALTKAIADNGSKLNLNKKIILDKHSSGGTPGNRTTMLIVPIIAAAGLTMPKTSSRAITSAAGTADVMEVLAKVDFPVSEIKKIVEKTNACIVWSGSIDLASADDMFIKIEHPMSLDPTGMLLASIMAKKRAVGASHILIDIPWGKEAKITEEKKARKLAKSFKKVARKLGIKVKVMLSDGSQPIGNGIGPALEAKDVLYVLMNDDRASEDLKEKALKMSGMLLEIAGIGDENTARGILESGKAYEKFKEIIKAQGGNPEIKPDEIKVGDFYFVAKANRDGVVEKLNSKTIAKVARVAGAPKDKKAGILLNVHKGDKVRKGDILFTVYSENAKKLKYTLDVFNREKLVKLK